MKNIYSMTSSFSLHSRKIVDTALVAAFVSLFVVTGSAHAIKSESMGKLMDQPAAADQNIADIVDTAVGAGKFSTLVVAVQEAGLVDVLKGEGPFTVFAPTDEAFAKIPEDQLKALLADKEALTAVLTYHVVPGMVLAEDVVALNSATTVQGGAIDIDTSDGVRVDGANVIMTDVLASNGVIHVIDSVIMPQ